MTVLGNGESSEWGHWGYKFLSHCDSLLWPGLAWPGPAWLCSVDGCKVTECTPLIQPNNPAPPCSQTLTHTAIMKPQQMARRQRVCEGERPPPLPTLPQHLTFHIEPPPTPPSPARSRQSVAVALQLEHTQTFSPPSPPTHTHTLFCHVPLI